MTWGDKDFDVSTHSLAMRVLRGRAELPDHLTVTDTCIHDHGQDGKTVRYVKSRQCIFCHREYLQKKQAEDGSCMVEIDRIKERQKTDDEDLW